MKPSDDEEVNGRTDGLPVGDSDEARFARVIRYFLGSAPRRGEKAGRTTPPPEDVSGRGKD